MMGANSDFYHAKKILARWYEKTSRPDKGDKVEWWLRTVEEKGVKPVMVSGGIRVGHHHCGASSPAPSPLAPQSHDILDGLSHARWIEYVASYKKLAAAHHQRTYHERKRAAIIKAKQENHRAARDLLGLAAPGDKKAGPSASGSGGG